MAIEVKIKFVIGVRECGNWGKNVCNWGKKNVVSKNVL